MNIDRWRSFSIAEQFGHIGSEIGRARTWEEKVVPSSQEQALIRALYLTDLTIASHKNDLSSSKEIRLFKAVLSDIQAQTKQYSVTLKELEQYCLQMAQLLTHQPLDK